jgi:hypothetical protein
VIVRGKEQGDKMQEEEEQCERKARRISVKVRGGGTVRELGEEEQCESKGKGNSVRRGGGTMRE